MKLELFCLASALEQTERKGTKPKKKRRARDGKKTSTKKRAGKIPCAKSRKTPTKGNSGALRVGRLAGGRKRERGGGGGGGQGEASYLSL